MSALEALVQLCAREREKAEEALRERLHEHERSTTEELEAARARESARSIARIRLEKARAMACTGRDFAAISGLELAAREDDARLSRRVDDARARTNEAAERVEAARHALAEARVAERAVEQRLEARIAAAARLREERAADEADERAASRAHAIRRNLDARDPSP